MSQFSPQGLMEAIESIMKRRAEDFDDAAAFEAIAEICGLVATLEDTAAELINLLDQHR